MIPRKKWFGGWKVFALLNDSGLPILQGVVSPSQFALVALLFLVSVSERGCGAASRNSVSVRHLRDCCRPSRYLTHLFFANITYSCPLLQFSPFHGQYESLPIYKWYGNPKPLPNFSYHMFRKLAGLADMQVMTLL